MKQKMYSFDVFVITNKGKRKKVATHAYPTMKQAKDARTAIISMPYGNYIYQPRENAPYVCRTLGGWMCSEITEIN